MQHSLSYLALLLVQFSIVVSGLGGCTLGNPDHGFRRETTLPLRTNWNPSRLRSVHGVVSQNVLRISGGGPGAERGGPYAFRAKDDEVLRKIVSAKSIPDLQKIVKSEKLSADRVGASYYVLAQLSDEGGATRSDTKAVAAELADEASRRMLSLDGKAVSSILWSLATLSKASVPADGKLVKSLSARVFTEGLAKDFTSQEVANVLWALTLLARTVERPVLGAIMDRVASTAKQFNPKSISRVLWAMAKLKEKPTAELTRTLCQRGQQLAYAFDASDIADATWALQNLDIDADASAKLVSALSKHGAKLTSNSLHHALEQLSASGIKADASATPAFVPAPTSLNPNPFAQLVGNVAGFVNSVAKNLKGVGDKLQDPEAIKALTEGMQPEKLAGKLREAMESGSKAHKEAIDALAAKGKAMASEFKAKDVVSTLQALAGSSAQASSELVEAMSKRGKEIAVDFDPAQIASALTALGSIGSKHGAELVEALGKRGLAIASEFSTQDVANTLQALAASGKKSGGQLLEAMGERGQELVLDFKPGELAKSLEALAAVAGSRAGGELVEALSARAKVLASQFSSSDAAAMLAAIAARGDSDTRELLEAVSRRAQAVAAEFKADELSKALGALAAIGNLTSSDLVQKLAARGQELAPSLDVQQVVNALAALAEVGSGPEGVDKLVGAVLQRAKRLVDSLNAQELANILRVLERLGPDADPELVKLLSERASHLTGKS